MEYLGPFRHRFATKELLSDYEGLSVDEAKAKAVADGYRVRVIHETTRAMTADFNHRRVTLAVQNGVVCAAARF